MSASPSGAAAAAAGPRAAAGGRPSARPSPASPSAAPAPAALSPSVAAASSSSSSSSSFDRVRARPSASALREDRPPASSVPCKFAATPQGCRDPATCRFLHTDNAHRQASTQAKAQGSRNAHGRAQASAPPKAASPRTAKATPASPREVGASPPATSPSPAAAAKPQASAAAAAAPAGAARSTSTPAVATPSMPLPSPYAAVVAAAAAASGSTSARPGASRTADSAPVGATYGFGRGKPGKPMPTQPVAAAAAAASSSSASAASSRPAVVPPYAAPLPRVVADGDSQPRINLMPRKGSKANALAANGEAEAPPSASSISVAASPPSAAPSPLSSPNPSDSPSPQPSFPDPRPSPAPGSGPSEAAGGVEGYPYDQLRVGGGKLASLAKLSEPIAGRAQTKTQAKESGETQQEGKEGKQDNEGKQQAAAPAAHISVQPPAATAASVPVPPAASADVAASALAETPVPTVSAPEGSQAAGAPFAASASLLSPHTTGTVTPSTTSSSASSNPTRTSTPLSAAHSSHSSHSNTHTPLLSLSSSYPQQPYGDASHGQFPAQGQQRGVAQGYPGGAQHNQPYLMSPFPHPAGFQQGGQMHFQQQGPQGRQNQQHQQQPQQQRNGRQGGGGRQRGNQASGDAGFHVQQQPHGHPPYPQQAPQAWMGFPPQFQQGGQRPQQLPFNPMMLNPQVAFQMQQMQQQQQAQGQGQPGFSGPPFAPQQPSALQLQPVQQGASRASSDRPARSARRPDVCQYWRKGTCRHMAEPASCAFLHRELTTEEEVADGQGEGGAQAAAAHPARAAPAAAGASVAPVSHAAPFGGWLAKDRVHSFRELVILEQANATPEELAAAAGAASDAAPQPAKLLPASEYVSTLLLYRPSLAGQSFLSLARSSDRAPLVRLLRDACLFMEQKQHVPDFHLCIVERRAEAPEGAGVISEAAAGAASDVANARSSLASAQSFYLKICFGGRRPGLPVRPSCMSCQVDDEQSNGARLGSRVYNNLWLDAQGREMVVVTPIAHQERLSALTDDQLFALFRDAYDLLRDAEAYASSHSAPASGLPPFVYETLIVNQGLYRNFAHLHLKARVPARVWKCIAPSEEERAEGEASVPFLLHSYPQQLQRVAASRHDMELRSREKRAGAPEAVEATEEPAEQSAGEEQPAAAVAPVEQAGPNFPYQQRPPQSQMAQPSQLGYGFAPPMPFGFPPAPQLHPAQLQQLFLAQMLQQNAFMQPNLQMQFAQQAAMQQRMSPQQQLWMQMQQAQQQQQQQVLPQQAAGLTNVSSDASAATSSVSTPVTSASPQVHMPVASVAPPLLQMPSAVTLPMGPAAAAVAPVAALPAPVLPVPVAAATAPLLHSATASPLVLSTAPVVPSPPRPWPAAPLLDPTLLAQLYAQMGPQQINHAFLQMLAQQQVQQQQQQQQQAAQAAAMQSGLAGPLPFPFPFPFPQPPPAALHPQQQQAMHAHAGGSFPHHAPHHPHAQQQQQHHGGQMHAQHGMQQQQQGGGGGGGGGGHEGQPGGGGGGGGGGERGSKRNSKKRNQQQHQQHQQMQQQQQFGGGQAPVLYSHPPSAFPFQPAGMHFPPQQQAQAAFQQQQPILHMQMPAAQQQHQPQQQQQQQQQPQTQGQNRS